MSDGATVYECTSDDEVIDLLQGGQGVFGIALGGCGVRSRESSRTPGERAADEAGAPCGDDPRAVAARRLRPPRLERRPDAAPARLTPPRTPRGRVLAFGLPRRRRGKLPGTSQAPGPRGSGSSGAARRATEGEASVARLRTRSLVTASTDPHDPHRPRRLGLRRAAHRATGGRPAAMLEVVGQPSLERCSTRRCRRASARRARSTSTPRRPSAPSSRSCGASPPGTRSSPR